MQKIKISKKNYKLATNAADITIRHYIECKEFFQHCLKLEAHNKVLMLKLQNERMSPVPDIEGLVALQNELTANNIQIVDYYLRIACICSPDLTYEFVGKNVPFQIEDKKGIRNNPIIEQMIEVTGRLLPHFIYQPPESTEAAKKISKKGFRFKNIDYYLLDFGLETVKQRHWFMTVWKQFFEETTQDVINMKMEKLPELIAIAAFAKNEVNLTINDGEPIPVSQDSGAYKKWIDNKNRKAKLFLDLPLSVSYRSINFLLGVSPNSKKIIHRYFQAKRKVENYKLN